MNNVLPLVSLAKTDTKRTATRKKTEKEQEVRFIPVEPPEGMSDIESDVYRELIECCGTKYFQYSHYMSFCILVSLIADYKYRRWYDETVNGRKVFLHSSQDIQLITNIRQQLKVFGLSPLDALQLNPANKRRQRKISTQT